MSTIAACSPARREWHPSRPAAAARERPYAGICTLSCAPQALTNPPSPHQCRRAAPTAAAAPQGGGQRHRLAAPAVPPARRWGHALCSSRGFLGLVGDEFQERTVGIAEVNTGTCTLSAMALHRPRLDCNSEASKMRHRIGDKSPPFEAEIAISWLNR